MATNDIGDLIATKLAARYPGVEKDRTALLQRYKADQAITTHEGYVTHVAGASPENNFVDDQQAFWLAFVP